MDKSATYQEERIRTISMESTDRTTRGMNVRSLGAPYPNAGGRVIKGSSVPT
ncbi:MAG: hypothetical protein IPP27_18900 [Bacteroidetes bacterium]|nr:hypothetical protein [Bacteroidota bacterium]